MFFEFGLAPRRAGAQCRKLDLNGKSRVVVQLLVLLPPDLLGSCHGDKTVKYKEINCCLGAKLGNQVWV